MKNVLIAQSGGPTAAINATLTGVLLRANIKKDKIDKVFGAKHGIVGVMKEEFIDLTNYITNSEFLHELKLTPAAALGSCRYKLKCEDEYKKIIDVFKKHNIGYFIYIGGNDSMDTVKQLHEYCEKMNITDIKIIGAPKTIDNDLVGTDHCPGFGSAAKYVATSFAEIERDCKVYDTNSVTIVEVMGRNTGWLTAASVLSKYSGGDGVDLIYLCEVTFHKKKFIEDVKNILSKQKNVVIAVSEGIKNENGNYVAEDTESKIIDAFGHRSITGVAKSLEYLVSEEIGCKVRSIELNIMQRCSSHILSKTDIDESISLGMEALDLALKGNTGVMVNLTRKENNKNYIVKLGSIDVTKVANHEKKVPLDMINEDGNYVTYEMENYLKPLIEGEIAINYFNGVAKHIIL